MAALTQLAVSCGSEAASGTWRAMLEAFKSATYDTIPDIEALLNMRSEHRRTSEDGNAWTLESGAGARRLAEIRCRASVQLLLAQACGELYAAHPQSMDVESLITILELLEQICDRSLNILGHRRQLCRGRSDVLVVPVTFHCFSSERHRSVEFSAFSCLTRAVPCASRDAALDRPPSSLGHVDDPVLRQFVKVLHHKFQPVLLADVSPALKPSVGEERACRDEDDDNGDDEPEIPEVNDGFAATCLRGDLPDLCCQGSIRWDPRRRRQGH